MFSHYIRALYGCFLNPELFRNVVYRWKNVTGIGFACLVVLIFSFISTGRTVVEIPPIVDQFVNHAVVTAPQQYTVKDGELSIDKELPYVMTFGHLVPPDIRAAMEAEKHVSDDKDAAEKDIDWNRPFIVFKQNVSPDDLKDYPVEIVLVGKKQMITRKSDGEIRIHSFEKSKDISFNLNSYIPFDLKEVVGFYLYLFDAFLWFFFFAVMWIGFVIKAFVIALLSFAVTAFIPERSLIFNDRFRIAIFALAPVYMMVSVLTWFNIEIGFWAVILAALLYFSAYIHVAKHTKSLMTDA